MKKKISIIVPIYNEEQNLATLYATVTDIIEQIANTYET